MTVSKYRKRPVVVEALHLSGYDENCEAITWVNANGGMAEAVGEDTDNGEHVIAISTLEGVMYADPDDYIIRGVKGEFYPCKPDIFEATYEWEPEPPGQDVPLSGYAQIPDADSRGHRERG